MAKSDLSVQSTSRDGLVPVFTAAVADGFLFDNSDEDVVVAVKNDSAAEITVTFETPAVVDEMDIPDKVATVAAGETAFIGPFRNALYGTADKQVGFVPSATASVEVAALTLGSLL